MIQSVKTSEMNNDWGKDHSLHDSRFMTMTYIVKTGKIDLLHYIKALFFA